MRSSVGAEMMIMVIMMMGDDQDWIRCSEGQCSPHAVYRCAALCTVCTAVQQGGGRDNAECAVSHSWEAAGRGAESDMRVSNGDNTDPEPGETKEHCAGPPSEYNLLLTTIHKTVITTFYSRTLV